MTSWKICVSCKGTARGPAELTSCVACGGILTDYDTPVFLTQIGLSQYIHQFNRHAVALDVLCTLSDADLKELGVELLGHRRLIQIRRNDIFQLGREGSRQRDEIPKPTVGPGDAAPPGMRQKHPSAEFSVDKSRVAALLLSIFLGSWGADRFYLGCVLTGFLKLSTTVASIALFIAAGTRAVRHSWGDASTLLMLAYVATITAGVWWIIDLVLIATGGLRKDQYGARIVWK